MLCKNCGKNIANTHIKHTVGGKTEELHLCSDCALKLGLNNFHNFDISDLWGSLFGESNARPVKRPNEIKCLGCDATFSEIAKSGKAGCPKCYTSFYDKLLPSLQRIHGKSQHIGRVPSSAGEKAKKASKLVSLKIELAKAIEAQEFEKAAVLRDEIEVLGKEVAENE